MAGSADDLPLLVRNAWSQADQAHRSRTGRVTAMLAAPNETHYRTVQPDAATDFERDAVPLIEPLFRHAMRMTGNRADAEDQ